MSWLKEHENDRLYVGAKQTTVGEAVSWVEPYLTQHRNHPSAKKPYSYPAYDAYPGHRDSELRPEDLLAPVLLNVRPSVKAYYTLLGLVDDVNERLRRLEDSFSDPESATLAQATESQLEAIAEVYGAMDNIKRGDGVGLTTFAKVLHLKQPELLPLWDRWVRNCYCSGREDRRIKAPPNTPPLRGFVGPWLRAVRRDLIDGRTAWSELASFASDDVPVSHLRVLDIVAWNLGQKS